MAELLENDDGGDGGLDALLGRASLGAAESDEESDDLLGLANLGAAESDDESDGGGVARVAAADVSAEEFARRFVATDTPAVLTGCRDQPWWPGWVSLDFLKRGYGDRTVPVDGRRCALGDFLARLDEERRYLRNVHLFDLLRPEDAARLRFPAHLGPNALRSGAHDVPKAWEAWFELFVLPQKCRGYPVLHRDMCETQAFSLQLAGTKVFTLFAPGDGPYLYALPPTYCRSALGDGGRAASLAEYPLFAKARPLSVRIEPGDMLFLPPNWWHTTRGEGPEPGLTLGGNFVAPHSEELFAAAYADYRQVKALSLNGLGAARILG